MLVADLAAVCERVSEMRTGGCDFALGEGDLASVSQLLPFELAYVELPGGRERPLVQCLRLRVLAALLCRETEVTQGRGLLHRVVKVPAERERAFHFRLRFGEAPAVDGERGDVGQHARRTPFTSTPFPAAGRSAA